MTALMVRAEVFLNTGQPELAWPLVEAAAGITGDRAALMPDAGFFERQQRHFCWATRGYEAVKSLGRRPTTALFGSLVDAMEVRLFDEAVAHMAGDPSAATTPVLDEAVATGLLGPLARLLASGVHHPAVPARLPGESAAQLVARAYPHAERTVIPVSISDRSTAVSFRSSAPHVT